MSNTWNRALLGTQTRLLSVVGVLVLLVVFAPIALLLLGLIVPAAASLVLGLLGFAAVVLALLPGRRRWR